MTEQPAPQRTPEEQAAIERGGKRWAIGIGVGVVAVVALCFANASRDTAPSAEDQQGDAKRACQEKFIADRLKAPASAKFSGVTVSESGGSYTVAGSVDSQNAFGALVRATFTCAVRLDGDQWILESAAVNG